MVVDALVQHAIAVMGILLLDHNIAKYLYSHGGFLLYARMLKAMPACHEI